MQRRRFLSLLALPLVDCAADDAYDVVIYGGTAGGIVSAISAAMAGATVAIVPSVLLFLLLQRFFIAGIATTGVKG